MRIAAAALVGADKDAIADLIPELRGAREKASSDETRLNLSLLLANAYRGPGRRSSEGGQLRGTR